MDSRAKDSCTSIPREKAIESRCPCRECIKLHTPASSIVGTDVIDESQQSGRPPKQSSSPPKQSDSSLKQSGDPKQRLSSPSVKENRQERRTDLDDELVLNTRHSADGASCPTYSSLNPNCNHCDRNHQRQLSGCNCCFCPKHTARSQPLSTDLHESEREYSRDSMTKPIIYLTFSSKSRRHLREIKKLCKELRDSLGFSVKCDDYDSLRKAGVLNIHQWRDTNYSRAKWIIFCISPGYSDIIHGKEHCCSPDEVCEHEKGIRYIYNIGRAEFTNNGSKHYRMIPLLFTKTEATVCHIPFFLASAPYYWFPNEKDELFNQLKKQN